MSDLIYTKGLKKYFKTPRGMLHAVDDINLTIPAGKTLFRRVVHDCRQRTGQPPRGPGTSHIF